MRLHNFRYFALLPAVAIMGITIRIGPRPMRKRRPTGLSLAKQVLAKTSFTTAILAARATSRSSIDPSQ